MKTDQASALRSVKQYVIDPVRRLYPTRQVYFRSNGRVRFISLSPRIQMAASVVILAGAAWVASASYFYVFRNDILAAKEQKLEAARSAFEQLNAEMARMESDLSTTVQAVQARQRYLEEMLAESDTSGADTPAGDQSSGAADPNAEEQAANANGLSLERGVGGPASVILDPTQPEQNEEPTAAETPAWWQEILDWWNSAQARPLDHKVATRSERIQRMQARITRLKAKERRLVTRMLERTEQQLARLRTPFETAGLKPAAVLQAATDNQGAMGGPLQALSSVERKLLPIAGDADFATLLKKRTEINEFQQAMASFPVVRPLKEGTAYYISSSFGVRSDPFTNGRALHGGLDMASHWKTPIHATSAGVVSFAGRNGPYGRMVEIDHGNGFKTRYGHMRTILVEKGQKVAQGDRVGLMGTSGRSTGTHLHYEVRFLDKPRNPIKFFKAQDHVLQSIQLQGQSSGQG